MNIIAYERKTKTRLFTKYNDNLVGSVKQISLTLNLQKDPFKFAEPEEKQTSVHLIIIENILEHPYILRSS